MNVAMVKHENCEKIYWFEVPDHLVTDVTLGIHVLCDTARGKKYGTVVGSVVNAKDVQISSATFPLRQIIAVAHDIALDSIKIPDYMKRASPSDNKIAKRFLEYYHTMKFDTNVVVKNDGTLEDGYSAYLVAKMLALPSISGIRK